MTIYKPHVEYKIPVPKDCPVCGNDAELIYYYIKGAANRKHCFVRCSECRYRPTKYGYSYRRENFEKAINNWNRSVEEYDQQRTTEAHEEFSKQLHESEW